MMLQVTSSILEARKSFLPRLHPKIIESNSFENTFKIIKSNCQPRTTPYPPSNHLHKTFKTKTRRKRLSEKKIFPVSKCIIQGKKKSKSEGFFNDSMIAHQNQTQYIEKSRICLRQLKMPL